MFLSIFKFSISDGVAIEGHRVENVPSLGLPCWVTSAPAVTHLQPARVSLPTMAHGQGSLLMSEIFSLLNFHSSVLWEISGLVRSDLCWDGLTHQVLLFCHSWCKGHLATPCGLKPGKGSSTVEHSRKGRRSPRLSYFYIIYPNFEGTSSGIAHYWKPP